ncbi:MAG: APC family permease [Polyangiaceae bacterium]
MQPDVSSPAQLHTFRMKEKLADLTPGMQTHGLRANAMGLLGAVTLGVVMLSPAMTLYACFGPAYLAAGKSSTLAFVWALLATLPTAASYALLSHQFPSSGSAASWISRACLPLGSTGAWIGRWAGWIVFLYYLNNFIIQPVTLGLFFNDLLTSLGVSVGFFTFVTGAVICCAWPARLVFRGIQSSAHGALRFLLIETGVVIALCATIAFVGHRDGVRFGAEGFTVAASPTGMHGMFGALLFGVLSFCGYDVISTLSEETRTPSRLIPQATFLALLCFGALMIGGVWLLGYAVSPERLREVSESGGMPITEIARAYWGKGAILVPIVAISASLGLAIATSVGTSRVLFSMAREGSAPERFATLSERTRSPTATLVLVFAVGFVAAVGVAACAGSFNAYVWWCTTVTFFALCTYLLVNLSALMLFGRRAFRSPSSFFLHGVVPLFGFAVDGYILVRAFFIELWGEGFRGRSVIFFALGSAALAGLIARR